MIGELRGALGPLVEQVGELRDQLGDLRTDTDRRHAENITLHNNQQNEMKEFIADSIKDARSSSSSEIALLKARLEPLEDDYKGRRSRAARKRQAVSIAAAAATLLAALGTFWGAIKAGLVGWLK